MHPQINYRCDVCEDKFLLDFQKSNRKNKFQCPHCHVEYEFSKEEIAQLDEGYQNYVTTLKEEREEKFSQLPVFFIPNLTISYLYNPSM